MSGNTTSGNTTSRYKTLGYAESNGVAYVTLNRPEVHNAFDTEMMREVYAYWRELRANDDVRGDRADRGGGQGVLPGPTRRA